MGVVTIALPISVGSLGTHRQTPARMDMALALGALDGHPLAAVLGARKERARLLSTLKPAFVFVPTGDKVERNSGRRPEGKGPLSLVIEGG